MPLQFQWHAYLLQRMVSRNRAQPLLIQSLVRQLSNLHTHMTIPKPLPQIQSTLLTHSPTEAREHFF
jgi:hypothetical protein